MTMKIFSVSAVLKSAYQSIVDNQRFYLLMAFALIVVNICFWILETHVLANSQLLLFVFSIILALIMAKYTIMIHRSILLDERHFGAFADWSSREVTFVVMSIVVGLLCFGVPVLVYFLVMMAINIEPINLAIIGYVVLLFVCGALVCRLSLIFPAIAVDKDVPIGMAWERSKSHTLMLFILIIALPIFVQIFLVGIMWLFSYNHWVVFLLDQLFMFIWVYEVTVLTHCYEYLIGSDPTVETIDTEQIQTEI